MKKILLLDDNLDIVQIVEEILSCEHFEVKSMQGTGGFLAVAETLRPDLIILDYRLVDGNGGQRCKEIKAHAGLRHTPVFIFSAYSDPGMDFSEFGCDAFIPKPFDLENLVATVNDLVSAGPTLLQLKNDKD